MPRKQIAIGAKADVNGEILDGAMKSPREIIGTSPFIEQPGEQGRHSLFTRRILRRAAARGKFKRHERHGVALDKPRLQARRR